MSRALHALLHGAIDYAGLFPPAALDLPGAVANYAAYLASDDAWALGRLVVPAAALERFGAAAEGAMPTASAAMPAAIAPLLDVTGLGALANISTLMPEGTGRWRLSAIVGDDVAADAERVHESNRVIGDRAIVDSVEAKATTAAEVQAIADAFPDQELFVEVAADRGAERLLDAVAAAGARAKIRTGGVTASAFPLPGAVLDFLEACQARRLRFKATAGLHHASRARYRLTYEADSAEAPMFGFLDVLVAAVLVRLGADRRDVLRLLEDGSAAGLVVSDDQLRWRDYSLSDSAISDARFDFVRSFGSCSFREPLDELQAMRLL